MNCPFGPSGKGINVFRKLTLAGLNRLAGIIPPGNGALVDGSIGLFLDCEKLPARSSAVGTTAPDTVLASLSRRLSQERKKKVRLWPLYKRGTKTGPPKEAPNWLRFRIGLISEKKFLASKASFRTNSYKDPWISLVPDLVIALTAAPELRPYSAL